MTNVELNQISVPVTDVNYRQAAATINDFLTRKGRKPYQLDTIDNQLVLQNKKAFTGGSAATGSGLIETRVDSPIVALTQRGGVFIESGINFRDNTNFNVTFNGVRLNGSYSQIACGTATPNEISTFSNVTVTLLRERAEIEGCEDVLARTPDANQALATFEQLLENEKLRLADLKVAAAITSNASVAAINPTSLSTVAPINDAMLSMIGNLAGFEVNVGAGHAFYLNQQGFAKLLKEQDLDGRNLQAPGFSGGYFTARFQDGRRPTQGLVGYFNGYPVYVTPGILNTYTSNASGVVTAQTGGTDTVVIFAQTGVIGLARINRQYDDVAIFNPTNDRQAYLEGEVTIGAWTYMAAGVIIPAAVNYSVIA